MSNMQDVVWCVMCFCNMEWCMMWNVVWFKMWSGMWHVMCFCDTEWHMMWNMVWFKLWLNVEWDVVCHVLLWYGMAHNMEYGVARCGMGCGTFTMLLHHTLSHSAPPHNAHHSRIIPHITHLLLHITHHALPHRTTTYCTPCYALTCMWDVSLWYGMVHVECGVVWCGMRCGMLTHCTPQRLNSTSHIPHLFMLHITHHTCIIKCKHNSASQPH